MIHVLYHSNCMDGTAARYAAWKKFGDSAEYKAVQYGSEFPDLNLTKEDTVYILDFSYSREILVGLSTYTNVVVIDHHETAMHALEGLDFAIFNMEKSGGVLAWEYFHPEIPVPQFLLILQDYDLWNWNHKDTLAVSAMFSTNEIQSNMRELDKLIQSAEAYYIANGGRLPKIENPQIGIASPSVSEIGPASPYLFSFWLSNGYVSNQALEKEVRDLIQKRKYTLRKFEDKTVAIFNTTVFISMMGHHACKIPGVDFSMSYFFKEDFGAVFSLRSPKGGLNVAEIAKKYGGGGHQGAAGFVVEFPRSLDFLKTLCESEEVFEQLSE